MVKKNNNWIDFVKNYAKQNNMKYNDALKDSKCKELYNKSKKSGRGILGDVLRYGKKNLVDMIPAPTIVKDIGNLIGDKVIEQVEKKTGLGMIKKRKNMGGKGLMPAGY